MKILGIESSCDETSAAVAEIDENGRKILSNIVASQISVHKLYGGVVPEIASRAHTEAISRVTTEALDAAGLGIDGIDAVAVTYTPGLIGALLVGVNFAKALAFAAGKPLIAVDHMKGHIAANFFKYQDLKPPFLAFAASGGHTSIMLVKSYTEYETIGSTRDDAIGEAFDKIGRVMGLEYPGGAKMDAMASVGDSSLYKFPSPAIPGDNLDFSFSGLKTAIINHINHCNMKNESYRPEDIAACFTRVTVDAAVKKLERALEIYGCDTIAIAGGVAANSHLRRGIEKLAAKKRVRFCVPELSLCGDNGAMIAAQGYYEFAEGHTADTSLNAFA